MTVDRPLSLMKPRRAYAGEDEPAGVFHQGSATTLVGMERLVALAGASGWMRSIDGHLLPHGRRALAASLLSVGQTLLFRLVVQSFKPRLFLLAIVNVRLESRVLVALDGDV